MRTRIRVRFRTSRPLLALLVAALVVACGGGESPDGASAAGSPADDETARTSGAESSAIPPAGSGEGTAGAEGGIEAGASPVGEAGADAGAETGAGTEAADEPRAIAPRPGSDRAGTSGGAASVAYAPYLEGALPPLTEDPATSRETERDWAIARRTVEWGRQQALEMLPLGEVMAIVGGSFVGAPYEPGTLELPGDEELVVNLRAFDCVTFVEHLIVLARLIVDGGDDLLDDETRFRTRYRDELTRLRYRGGALDGYPSRLHYFSEWIRDGETKGLVRDLSAELGGVPDARPIDFMSSNPEAYRQIEEDPSLRQAVRATERRISAESRHYIPQEEIEAAAARGIRNGDVIAAVSSVDGLDIAHTGIALWQGGRLHLLHAPLVGENVELSRRTLGDRIRAQAGQQGIMVARPLEPGEG